MMTRTLCSERERERGGGCPVCTTLMALRTLSCRWRSSRTSCGEERRAIHPVVLAGFSAGLGLSASGMQTYARLHRTQAHTAQIHGNTARTSDTREEKKKKGNSRRGSSVPKTRGAYLVVTAARELREEGYDEGFAIIALGHALFAEERLEPAHGVPGTLWGSQRKQRLRGKVRGGQ